MDVPNILSSFLRREEYWGSVGCRPMAVYEHVRRVSREGTTLLYYIFFSLNEMYHWKLQTIFLSYASYNLLRKIICYFWSFRWWYIIRMLLLSIICPRVTVAVLALSQCCLLSYDTVSTDSTIGEPKEGSRDAIET